MNSVSKDIFQEGWENTELGDICDVVGGGTPKTKVSDYWDGEIVWLSPVDLPPIGEISIVSDSRKKITALGLQKSSAKLLPKGSVIYSTRASIGKIAIAEIPLSTNQGFTNFICKEQISNYFLCYALKHFNKNIEELSNSTTFKEVSKSAIKSFKIPLPPLAEQKRIVAKIDVLFAKIDKAISLTEESLKQAKNLLPSILKEVFENCEGETMTLNKVSEIQPKKNQVKNLDCEVSFVPMKFLNEKKIDFVPESDRNISEVYKGYTYFQDGDVLLAKVIPCFQNGKSGVAKGLTNGIGFGSSEFIVFRPYDFILQEWLYYNISSPDFLFEGNNNMSGAVGLKRLIKSFVTDWEIKVPDLKTQKMYIDTITKVSNQSKQTQSKLKEQLVYLKKLKSSILSKAFQGVL